jgi:hypothetical protein
MSDKRDEDEDPGKQLVQGLGMLFKAATGAAKSVKKELDKTDVGKAFEDAGREFARAASSVAERVSAEISGKKRSEPPPPHHEPPADAAAPPDGSHEDDEFDGVKPAPKKPTGPTPEDPGFRIAVDDDEKKKPQ